MNSSVWAAGNVINAPIGSEADSDYTVPGFSIGEKINFSASSTGPANGGLIGISIGTLENTFPGGDGDNSGGNFAFAGSGQFTIVGASDQTLFMAYYVHNNGSGQTVPGTLTVTLSCVQAPPTIASISPAQGPIAGNTTITITGTDFTGATAVDIGGITVTPTSVTDTSLTVVTPAHAAGAVSVSVTTPGGTSGTGTFTYRTAPTIGTITPDSGTTLGSSTVTITGTGFLGASGVTFGGTGGTSLQITDDTTLSISTPAHVAGAVDVVVTAPGGPVTATNGYTYVLPPPIISSVSPSSGTTAGNTNITINGQYLTGTSAVTFGGVAATNVFVVSDTQVTATTPSHAAGSVTVTATTPSGTASVGSAYTYVAPVPAVSAVSPNSGTTAGGTSVSISGSGFTAATAVTIGGTAATGVTIVSDTQITATTPSHIAGVVNVAVTTAGGTGGLSGAFTYIAPTPSVSSVSPNTGLTAGGTSVTISGSGFIGATAVTIGGNAATGVIVVSDTQITASTPSHIAGAVTVAVTTAGGTGSLASSFTYLAPIPIVSSVSPNTGLTAGGTTVTIIGSGFIGATSVTFGGNAATGVTVVSDTQITAQTPSRAAGSVTVSVATAGGTGSVLSAFTYLAPVPFISGITPNTGSTAGGTGVTITGSGFTAATSVTFGGTAASNIVVLSDTQVTATTPAHVAGAVSIALSTAGGTGLLGSAFTYVAGAPVVSGVSPVSGLTAGGTNVTITGSGFIGATAVTFDGMAATSVNVVSDTQITADTPSHIAGAVTVAVTTAGGTGSLASAYTYLAPIPSISNVSPSTGLTAGGASVTITGVGFTGTNSVTFGGIAATSFNVVSDTQVVAQTPPRAAGTVNVQLSTAGGSGTLVLAYNYLAPIPSVNGISPGMGTTLGGTPVTITGVGFTAATAVKIGGVDATDIVVVNDTQITATSPAHGPGPSNVSVATAGGTGILLGGYTYVTPIPVVSGVSPSTGTTLGGTNITITGSGLTGATSVLVGGTAATGVVVVNDTQITAVTPAHAAGAVDVSVTTPGGTVSLPSAFTYAVFPPTITSVSPSTGTTLGGTIVTLTGSNLTGTSAVSFGGMAATGIAVISDTQVKVTTPAHAAGAVNIVVTTPVGTGGGGGVVFTYILPIRPDPTLDAEVIGLISAQTMTANRFARTQMRNFHSRIERLHNERERRAASMNVRLGLPTERNRTPSEQILDAQTEAGTSRLARAEKNARRDTSYGYGTDGDGPVTQAAGSGLHTANEGPEFSRLAFWSGGFVNFGDRDDGGVDIDHTTVGVSGGFDYRFSERFVAGLGIGYGRDRTDIGDNGTESKGQAFNAAVYASFEPFDNFFLDGLFGGGKLNFDSRRFVTANGEIATGERSGSQIFGSVTAAYEIREETWLVSPYGRVEFSRSWLDGFSERGGGIFGLTYGSQTADTLSGVLGVRANKSFDMEWGVLKPGIRAEFVHDFEGSSRVRMGYTDLATMPYELEILAKERNYATLGLSLEFQFENDWNLLLDYRTALNGEGDVEHSVGAQLSVRF